MLDQHPVPQNVTNFQFRLIGDMTIKQFGYLAAGAILGYVAYSMPLPVFITYPLAGLFVLGGIGFAFVPVEERPMDVWFLSFIKSIYSPTQYLWQREVPTSTATTTNTANSPLDLFNSLSLAIGKILPAPPVRNSMSKTTTVTAQSTVKTPQVPLVQTSASPTPPLITKKQSLTMPNWSFTSLFAKRQLKQQPVIQPVIKPTMIVDNLANQVKPPPQGVKPAYIPAVYPSIMASSPIPHITGTHLDQPVTNKQSPSSTSPQINQTTNTPIVNQQSNQHLTNLEERLKQLEEQLAKERAEKLKVTELQNQLVSALNDKQKLSGELAQTKQQLQQKPVAVATKQAAISMVPEEKSQTVKVISPQAAKFAGMPSLSLTPNVVCGIVREPTGNFLVGVLVTVKDKDDIPVRALKTNKLGQFAASTPLANGTYTIEAEDPKRQMLFDLVKVTLVGVAVPPIELIAKTQKQLERQKLEQALFGTPVANQTE